MVRAEGEHERRGQRDITSDAAEASEGLELFVCGPSAVKDNLIADLLALQLFAQFSVGLRTKILVLRYRCPSLLVLRLGSY